MNQATSFSVTLLAGGCGERMGGLVRKQYGHFEGHMLFEYSLDVFLRHKGCRALALVVPSEDVERMQSYVDGKNDKRIFVCAGGKTRQESSYLGLCALNQELTLTPWVLIHDASRPFVCHKLIDRLLEGLLAKGCCDNFGQEFVQKGGVCCVPFEPIEQSLYKEESGSWSHASRSHYRMAQTPQAFSRESIILAHECARRDQKIYDDDIAVAMAMGTHVVWVPGERGNFKVTYQEDKDRVMCRLQAPQPFLKHNKNDRCRQATGLGFDVHAFSNEGREVILCGIKIPSKKGSLKGHSDADVGLHALTDAILGALALGDLGDHFPPSDPRWGGVSSSVFLESAMHQLKARHGLIEHADILLIAECPQIAPYKDEMKQHIAKLLESDFSRINVKATTTERLGFVGREEGIAAQAIVTVRLP